MDLSVTDLVVTAPGGRVLLALPRLDLPSGAALGLSGPSGAGKSTLLLALAGLMPGMRGAVRWGGTDLAALTPAARQRFAAARFGIVFQDYLLFDELGAAENAAARAMFAPRAARAGLRTEAGALLRRFGVDGGAARSVASLSGGERQRVAVARALATRPPVILADEPTASLDREAADRLIDDLTATARDGGATLVCVSHDPALLARMDRVLTLRDGAPADA